MNANRLPFSVEALSRAGVWFEVLDVPAASITSARSWLRAQGSRWTIRRHWRIVDRAGKVVKEFIPKGERE